MQVDKTSKMLEIEKCFGRDLEEILREKYAIQQKSTVDIANEFGIVSSRVSVWLEKCNIERRSTKEGMLIKYSQNKVLASGKTHKMIEIESKLKGKLNEILRKMYVNEGLGTPAIAKKLGVGDAAIGRWLDICGIPKKSPSAARLPVGIQRPSKETLEKAYCNDRISPYKIAREFGVSSTTIYNWFREAGIPTRSVQDSKLPAGFIKPSKEELWKLYAQDILSTIIIGKRLGVTSSTVGLWLDKYKIPLRSIREARLRNVKMPSKEQLHKLYFVDGMSTTLIAKKLGITDTTVSNWLHQYGFFARTNCEGRWPGRFCGKDTVKELLKSYVDRDKYAS